MRQLLQNLRTGETLLATTAAPTVECGHLLIKTCRTLVSLGTEKMLVLFGRSSLLQKARSQPEKVRQVIGKIRSDGLLPTAEAVFRKLDEPLPLGYCNSGVVIGVGPHTRGFAIGDRVASNGVHAEFVSVPANLVARIPDNVSEDAAAFTVVGAIGLQGIRLAKPELGETFVVVGLGLIGQLTAQSLKAHGCQVIGFDFDASKVAMARAFGIMAMPAGGEVETVKWVLQQTGGIGADGVIITASSSSHDVISQSARMSRKRGRIVLVGVVGLNINRADFYEKELTFQVSCSYGPGRYDDVYEEKGYDYPPAYVRWTENRNFQAVLELISRGSLKVEPLITQRVRLEDYREIYDHMDDGGVASILVYSGALETTQVSQSTDRNDRMEGVAEGSGSDGGSAEKMSECVSSSLSASKLAGDCTIRVCDRDVGFPALAVIGAGNFTKMTAMPALVEFGAPVKTIVSSGGVTGTSLARKYKVPFSTTDYSAVLADPDIRGVIITTRHHLHAAQAIAALRAGKHVLVEKPLCLSVEELDELHVTVESLSAQPLSSNLLTPWVSVGFNRRFSSHIERIKELLCEQDPISIVATMNAGAIPSNHWVHDPEVGGGRIVGEACHYVDLAIHLSGSLVVEVSASQVKGAADCVSILLRHANGSTAVVNYFAHGHREVSKERIEVHSLGRTLLLDNFRETTGYGFKSFSRLKTRPDKGHARQFALFAERVKEWGPALIPWQEIRNGTMAILAVGRAIAERRVVAVAEMER